MTLTVLMTPWYRRVNVGVSADDAGATHETAILDHGSAPIRQLVERASALATSASGGVPDPLQVLSVAHGIIKVEIRAVYALAEQTSASKTFTRGFGSCSQRLAVLESVARAISVRTRVRGLLIDRSFWYPRFPRTKMVLPDRMLLAWPEFHLDGWQPASELFGSIGCHGGGAFTNDGSETLFEAIGRCAVDWDGKTRDSLYDLSRFIRADYGYFSDRDELFKQRGQTLAAPVRMMVDPILRRVSA